MNVINNECTLMKLFKINFYIKSVIILLITSLVFLVVYLFPVIKEYILLVLSLLIFFYCLVISYWYRRVNNWTTVDAVIKDFHEQFIDTPASQYSSIKQFYPEIEYEYNYNNVTCRSDKVFVNFKDVAVPEMDFLGREIDKTERPWYGWKEGDVITVYVNPKKTCASLVFTKMSKSNKYHHLSYLVLSLMLFISWLYLKEIGRFLVGGI